MSHPIYHSNPTETFGYPERGEFIVDMTDGKIPEIPDFLKDYVHFYDTVKVNSKDGHFVVMDPRYVGKDEKLERIVVVGDINFGHIVYDDTTVMVKYSLTSLLWEGEKTWFYNVYPIYSV